MSSWNAPLIPAQALGPSICKWGSRSQLGFSTFLNRREITVNKQPKRQPCVPLASCPRHFCTFLEFSFCRGCVSHFQPHLWQSGGEAGLAVVMCSWDLPWRGWRRQPQAPEVTGAGRQSCIHQVQQVTVTETMSSPTSRAPPCREIFLYLPGRCQPCAQCLQKGRAREQSRSPEGSGAITSSELSSGKTGCVYPGVMPAPPMGARPCLGAV